MFVRLFRGRSKPFSRPFSRPGRRVARGPLVVEPLERRELLAYTVPLVDNTGLTDTTLWAIGYTFKGTPTRLEQAGTSTTAAFQSYGAAPAAGKIEGVKINRGGSHPVSGGISEIRIDDADNLNGGVILVVAVPDSWAAKPFVTYTGTGTAITGPGYPNNNWPDGQPSFVWTELEFTKLASRKLTIDSTAVNSWSMPVTGTLGSLQLGQPTTLERGKVLEAYTSFIAAESNLQGPAKSALRTAYQNLYNASLGWIISPFSFGLGNLPEAFNTAWDADLQAMFGGGGKSGMKNIRVYFPGENDYWTGNSQATPNGAGGFNHSLLFTKDGTSGTGANEWFRIDSPLNPSAVSAYGSAGFQVFGCTGTFLNPTGYVGAGKPIGTQIVAALNRGVGLVAANPAVAGSNSQLWSTQTNWYPRDQNYNNYARFFHSGTATNGSPVSVYSGVTPVADNQGKTMGPAYGFPQDENSQNFVPGQPQVGAYPVPFEFLDVPNNSAVTFTFGPWDSYTPSPFVGGTSFAVDENAVNANLQWPIPPLAGFTNSPVTVAVALTGGTVNGTLTLTPQSVTGGTITPTGSAAAGWQVSGTQSQLNEYFTKAGAVTFTPIRGSTATQQLTMSAQAGAQQGNAASSITIVATDAGPRVSLQPASFTTAEGVPVVLAYSTGPFSDTDPTITSATLFQVTVTAAAGSIEATSTPDILVGGTPTARTFTPINLGGQEALAALNRFFTGGNVRYTPPAGSLATQTLATVLRDTTDTKTSNTATTQVFIGQAGTPIVQAPIAFWVPVDRRRNLAWPRGLPPFADADSRTLTVRLSVAGGPGTLTAAGGGGVTRNPDGSLTGTVRALNAYFRTAGRITYATSGGSLLPRVLSVFATDGTRSGTATSAILVRSNRPSGLPAINRSAALGSTSAGRPLVITYDQLVTATGAATANSRSVEFLLAGVSSGRLQLWDGAKWIRVPASLPQFKEPILAPGGLIRWTPPAAAPGRRAAFRVVAWDGWMMSTIQSQVSIDVT